MEWIGLLFACGMCVVAGWGAVAVVGQYVKYRNARRRVEAEARAAEQGNTERGGASAPQPQPV